MQRLSKTELTLPLIFAQSVLTICNTSFQLIVLLKLSTHLNILAICKLIKVLLMLLFHIV